VSPQKSVRTYLDPDAVGPLPRATFADDSDELSNARTMVQGLANTVELRPEDVIDVFDPSRPRPESVAPVGYDTAIVLPRRRLGPYVVAVVGAALGVLLLAVVQGARSQPAPPVTAVGPAAAPAAAPAPQPVSPTVVAQAQPAAAPAAPAATTGTLRIVASAEGQRVFVDGVELSATAALLRCGPHDIAVGSVGRTRSIDVPCGGEVTVYR
jgi:hypothetical protein